MSDPHKPLAPPNPKLPMYETTEERLAAFYRRCDEATTGEAPALTFHRWTVEVSPEFAAGLEVGGRHGAWLIEGITHHWNTTRDPAHTVEVTASLPRVRV